MSQLMTKHFRCGLYHGRGLSSKAALHCSVGLFLLGHIIIKGPTNGTEVRAGHTIQANAVYPLTEARRTKEWTDWYTVVSVDTDPAVWALRSPRVSTDPPTVKVLNRCLNNEDSFKSVYECLTHNIWRSIHREWVEQSNSLQKQMSMPQAHHCNIDTD